MVDVANNDHPLSQSFYVRNSNNMKLKDQYVIKPIPYKTAMELVIKHHYLHRKAQASYCFGLFSKDTDELVGCITYGLPASPNVCRGICGEEYFNDVIELTRLWIDDSVGKNAESFLIGNTLKLVDKNIIVSYAEPDHGHVGVVYQATNWIYTGLTAKRTNRVAIDGSTYKHNRHECMNKVDTILVPRPRKHRYVYFNCNKRMKKALKNKLRYKILPYPKKSTQ